MKGVNGTTLVIPTTDFLSLVKPCNFYSTRFVIDKGSTVTDDPPCSATKHEIWLSLTF